MYHIVYFSNAAHYFTADELVELLKVSRKNNERDNVTGILLYLDGCFLQILEGEKDKVLAVYEKINNDNRHHDILTLYEGERSERIFKDWSMGFQNISVEKYKEITGFTDISNEDFIKDIVKNGHPRIIKTLEIFYTGGLS